MSLRFVPLGSGSRGNAALLEGAGQRLLVDAGLAARTLERRLEGVGVAPSTIDGILLSHEHQDHSRGAERFSKRHGVPVICSRATLEAMDRSPKHFAAWSPLVDNGSVDVGAIRIESFPVPHDAASPVGFVVTAEGLKVGIATDLGHATTLVLHRLKGCNLLMLESNHDTAMLSRGPYPWHLKQRVSGRMGHLSNYEAAEVLARTVDDECRAVVLAHLSEHNNTPYLARRTAARALADAGCNRVAMRVASPWGPSPPVTL